MKRHLVEPGRKINLAELDPRDTFKNLKMEYPKPKDDLSGVVIE